MSFSSLGRDRSGGRAGSCTRVSSCSVMRSCTRAKLFRAQAEQHNNSVNPLVASTAARHVPADTHQHAYELLGKIFGRGARIVVKDVLLRDERRQVIQQRAL